MAGCATFPDADTTAKLAEQMVREAHTVTGPDLNRRTVQDTSQRTCSTVGGAKPTQEQAAAIVKTARESMRYPASGKFVGDWKTGARLVAERTSFATSGVMPATSNSVASDAVAIPSDASPASTSDRICRLDILPLSDQASTRSRGVHVVWMFTGLC